MFKKLNLILLIDDDADDNFFHTRIIKKLDLAENIEVQYDGQEAMEFLTNKDQNDKYPRPDLIFLDINMPGVDGWEFLEMYIKLPAELKGGPVITMLTTSLNPNDRKKAEKLSIIKGYYNKPLTEPILQEIMSKYFP